MNSDSIELLQLFAREKIKYLIVGGYAVSFHTEPRYTKDIDIFIATDRFTISSWRNVLLE